jgi:hypothetical protein
VEHYPYDYVVDAPKDDLLSRPRFSTRQYDALFVRLDTEYASALKPKSHPLRLIADALRAQSTGESATPEDDGLWDAIKKASLTFHATEGSNNAEPVPLFSNVFSDETIRLLSLIPADVSDKDKSAPAFFLQSPISPGRPRSFSLPETPLSPVQADHGRSPPSSHAYVVPSLTANNSTAPTTALETPTDWLQFSSNGFGTIPGTRDLVATLWDNDVEVTAPPPAPLSRKSSRRAHSQHSRHSRHSSLDTPRTPVPPLPAAPATATSKTTLIAKVKLDEAFVDFWADSLLDPVSRRWPRFVLCQLKPLPPAVTSAAPTPAWLVIEQRFVRVVPVPPVMEEAEVTVPPARPRPASPRPESSRLSAAFSIASKRFGFFTGGSSDPKSPKEKTAPLPQVGEFGEGAKGTGDGAAEAAEKSEEAGAKVSVDQGAVPAVTTVGATALAVVGVATATAAAAQEEITQKPRDDGLPTVAETTSSELASVSAPKADEPVKDEPPHNATTQNGLTHDTHRDEEQYEVKSETVPAQSPAGADPLVSPPVTGELVKTETEPLVSGAETGTAQPEPTSIPAIPYFAGISESPPVQPETAPREPSLVPVVEEAASAEGIITTPVVPEPAFSDTAILEEPKSANATPAPIQAPVLVPAAVVVEEPVVDDTAAAQLVESEPVVEVKATEQDLPADEVVPNTEWSRTFEEVPAPAAEPVVSMMPKAALPEGSAEDLLVVQTSAAAPVPASEQTAHEDDISTMREAQVASSADSEPIIIKDSSTMDPESVPTDDAAPATQTSPVHEGQTIESIDSVETTVPLEEPVEVAGESVIKEDAQPSAIPERDDVIPEVEAIAPEPATEPLQVASDAAFPVLGNADSAAADQAAPEASAPNDEPDVGHVVVVTQSVEECLPLHDTPQMQDAVIEEQLTAEETNPIPDASTSESISAGVPTTSNDDETDTAPAESAVAESKALSTRVSNIPLTRFSDILAVEPTTSSENSPSEELEGPTEPAPEPLTTIAHDAARSPASGSAEPAVAHVEQADVEATVLVDGNESTASPIDEVSALKVQPSVAAESQATINDSESVLPHEEPLAPAPEASLAVVEESAPPEAEIPVEMPAPSQEPAPSEATAPDVLEIPAEAPVSVPAESGLVSEVAPIAADASIADAAPAIEEPTPLLEEDVPVTADAPTDPSPLHEEPAPTTEAAMPTAEIPAPVSEKPSVTHEHSVRDTVEIPVPDEDGPVVEEDGPVREENGPVVEEDVPIVEGGPVREEDGPVVEDDGPVLEDGPVVEEDGPVVEEDGPVLEEDVPIREEDVPIREEDVPVCEEDVPVLEDGPIVKEDDVFWEDDPVAEEDAPAAAEPPVENSGPLPEDLVPATESAAPTADEIPVGSQEHDEEGLPTLESATGVTEETAPAIEEQAGLEETVEAEPVVEESLPSEEQVAQEPAAHSSCATTAIATQEEPPNVPGVDSTAASEPEAPLVEVDAVLSETTGAADAPSW